MSTHELRAQDLNWAEINFESPREAFKFASKLEKLAADPKTSPDDLKRINETLDELFLCLFDL